MRGIKIKLAFLVYLFINSLFIYKYGLRQNYINVFWLLLFFPTLILGIWFLLSRVIIKKSVLKNSYFIIVILFFLASILINYFVEGESLNVDRWSAIDVSVRALLNGEYPYNKLDHLNNYSSNLPSLIFLGIPFYFLGDVGYIQPFFFLFYSYFIYKTINNSKIRLIGILILILSPFYLWEIYTKSDLLSNFILVLGFCVLWLKKYGSNKFKRPFLFGMLVSLLLLTRIPVLIPLTLFFFKEFIKERDLSKTKIILSSLIVGVFSLLIVLINCPDLETLINFNPLIWQGNKIPLIVSLFIIIAPFYFSFKTKKIENKLEYSILFLAIPAIVGFAITLIENGLNDVIYNFSFDISYFNMMTPFLIYYILLQLGDEKEQLQRLL